MLCLDCAVERHYASKFFGIVITVKKILEWIETHRLESTAVAVILAIATYCSIALTTNAAVDSLNEALTELQQQVQQREAQAERELRGAVLDAYPDLLRAERAYNMRFRQGLDALTREDHRHVRAMEEVIGHYRPMMQAALRAGVRPHAMRNHMQGLIVSDPHMPTDSEQVSATSGGQQDRI